MMETESLTPPLSPSGFDLGDLEPPSPELQQLEDVIKTACFHCLGDVVPKGSHFHGDSYWKSAYITRICRESFHVGQNDFLTAVPQLFAYSWSSHSMLGNDLNRIFLILRQQIGSIQMLAAKPRMTFDIDSSIDVSEKRTQINDFLQFLLDFLMSDIIVPESQLETIINQVHSVLLHIGRIPDLPHHVTESPGTSCNNKNNASHQCFHLHLDVYWRLLCVVNIVQNKYPGFVYNGRLCNIDTDVESSLYDQLLQIILWDLITLANTRYMNKIVNNEYTKVSMFSCTCVKELWLLMLKLSEWRTSTHTGESFWLSLHHVIKSVSDMDKESVPNELMEVDDCRIVINPPEGLRVEDRTSLCLWIMYNVAPLYTHTVPGNGQEDGRVVSNYHDLQTLLKKFITSSSVTEGILRRHLRTCLQLTRSWEPNTNILVILWDYFYRRLNQNDTFQGTSSMIDGLACVQQSVASFYDRCQCWTQGNDENIEKDTSYQLFLRILSQHLGKLYSGGSTQEWKQMKGRIYSKFHQRRVQELLEGGLHNLTSLFVTLAMTTDLEDVASKLCDFYDMLDIHKITFAKRSVIWRGAFTMMLVYEERRMDVSFLTDRMVMAFESAVSDFKTADINTKHSLWKLLLIYLEGTQEVVEASTCLQTSEHKLLCNGMKSLLSSCSENELRTVLTMLQSVVNKFREVSSCEESIRGIARTSLQHLDFAGALWRCVYTFVVDHSHTLTPPPQLADLAAAFCLLSLTFPPGESLGNTDTFTTVFQCFAGSEKTNISVSCRFLGHLLSMGDVMSRLRNDLENRERFIISAWFRCCLHLPASAQQLAEITRPVLQMQSVRDIFARAEMDIPADLDIVPIHFLKAIERAHRKIQSWQDKMAFQEQIIPYFSDVSRHIAPVLRNLGPSDALSNIYRMSGNLVKYCAKLIYIRQDKIIPTLISSLIVPHHVMNPDKPVNPALLAVVKETLHLFIQGLGKLPYERDPFVHRRLKDIATVYLPKYSLRSSTMSMTASSVSTVHPVVASLSGSFIQQPLPEAVKFRHHVLQLVINNFIVVRNLTVHPSHSMGISFLHDVMQRTISLEVKTRDLAVILPVCLEYMLLLPDQAGILQSVASILQQMMGAYCYNSDVLPLASLTAICEKFVTNFMKFSCTGVIMVMEKLSVLQQEVVISVMEKLSSSVKEIENKRGVGVDQKLRQKYYRLLKRLGSAGEDEIQKMQKNS